MADPAVGPRPGSEASFEQFRAAVSATIGIAVAAPGRAPVRPLGAWSTGVAWSTIKVPLAIAALRADRSRAEPLVIKMITESDNPASEALWSQLGEPADAARQVRAVLEEAGDSMTAVESRRLRPGFTAFGQTQWDLEGQARFAARLPSLPGATTVIDLMRSITTGQRWGLAAKGLAAKGGWGPDLGNGYLVRQFGIMPTVSGHVGVALAADADSFGTGVDVVNAMADWLVDHLPALAEQ
jgi:hypothetical protein